jgi:hypothetical protein
VAVGPPAGLVGVFGGRAPILPQEVLGDAGEQAAQAMQSINEAAVANACLGLEAAERNAVDVVLHGDVGQELIAVEGPR